jgi:hypothetical protein
MMKQVALVTALGLLACGCVAPIETQGVASQLAGHCKLVAYQTDQTAQQNHATGALGFAIAQSNENVRRQEIFNACVQAGGQ